MSFYWNLIPVNEQKKANLYRYRIGLHFIEFVTCSVHYRINCLINSLFLALNTSLWEETIATLLACG